MSGAAPVRAERRGATWWITLDRPEAHHALSRALVAELRAAVAAAAADAQARMVVITGAGDKAFCAGADLRERTTMDRAETRAFVAALNQTFDAIAALPQLTVAALNGVAFGGGLELALACDLRLAVPTATLGLTEVRVGIIPGAGGTRRLPRLLGEGRARELILLGRRIPAPRAYQAGLVNDVVDDLPAAVAALAAELEGCAPLAVGYAKRALAGALSEADAYEGVLASADRDEGLRAFSEKRPPRFRGE